MSELIVRHGTSDDHETAIAIYLAANDVRRGAPTPPHHIERVQASLRKPDAIFLIAEDADVPAGMALAMPARENGGAGEPVPGLCYLSMVFVTPDRWGNGIGGALVETVLAEAQARDYDRVMLWTHRDNSRAQRLYERLRFHATGREIDNDLGERIVQYERECASRP
jgi:GNAT superfamily N-acetyltransferase